MRERWEQRLLEEQEEEGLDRSRPALTAEPASALRMHASQSRGGGLKISRAAQTDLSPGPRAESSEAVGRRAACRVSPGLALRRLSDTLNTYLGSMRRST